MSDQKKEENWIEDLEKNSEFKNKFLKGLNRLGFPLEFKVRKKLIDLGFNNVQEGYFSVHEKGIETDLLSGNSSKLDFPASDVLQFITEDGSIISARPSGTEPKIKFYCSVNGTLANKSEYKAADQQLEDKITAIMDDLAV